MLVDSEPLPISSRLAWAITSVSRRWVVIALVAALTAASLYVLQVLGAQLEQLVGFPPFDLQTPLARDAVLTQSPLYDAEALAWYGVFLLVDTVFPLAASLLLALILARSISAYQRLAGKAPTHSRIVLLPLLGAVLDWTENVFFALALGDPNSLELWASIAVGVKATKVVVSVILISSSVLVFAGIMTAWSAVAGLRRKD